MAQWPDNLGFGDTVLVIRREIVVTANDRELETEDDVYVAKAGNLVAVFKLDE